MFRRSRSLDADDIFISYSRLDGRPYLKGIEAALSAEGFSCFHDEYGSEASPITPETFLRKVESCKTLVLIGSPGAVAHPEEIEREVSRFAEANGTERIIAISFDWAREPMHDWSNVSWNEHVQGKARVREYPAALKSGKPCPKVVDAIDAASNYMKSKDRLRRYRNGAWITFLVLVVASAIAGVLAMYLSQLAHRQETIAHARSLASRAQLLLRQRPEMLQTSIALGMAAVRTASSAGFRSADIDSPLREAIALLPRPLARTRYADAIVETALSPDGQFFAAATGDGTVRIYRIGETRPVGTTRCEGKIALSNGAAHVACGTYSHIMVTGLLGENPRRPIEIRDNVFLQSIALSPGGRYVLTISTSAGVTSQTHEADLEAGVNTSSIWDMGTGEKLVDLPAEISYAASFSDHGDLAVAGAARLRSTFHGFSGRAYLWSLPAERNRDGSPATLTEAHFAKPEIHDQPNEILAIAWGSEGRHLATETTFWKRDALGKFEVSSLLPSKPGEPAAIRNLAFAKDSTELVVVRKVDRDLLPGGSSAIDVERWDVTGHSSAMRVFVEDPIAKVHFWEHDHFVAAALQLSHSHNPRVFDVRTGRERTINEQSRIEPVAHYISTDARFVASADVDHVCVHDAWQPRTDCVAVAAEFRDVSAMSTSLGGVAAISLSKDGRFLVVLGSPQNDTHGLALLYARGRNGYTRSKRLRTRSSVHAVIPNQGNAAAVTADGRVVVLLAGGRVTIWDVANGIELTPAPFRIPKGRQVESILLSPGGRYIALVTGDAPDENRAASEPATPNLEIVVIRLRDHVMVRTIPHDGYIHGVVFSPNDRYLAAYGQEWTTHLYRLDGSAAPLRIPSDAAVTAAAFSADESLLAIGTTAGTVSVFDVNDPQTEIARLQDTGGIQAIAFSSDGRFLATGSERDSTHHQTAEEDRPVSVWQLDPQDLIASAAGRLAAIPADLRESAAGTP